MLIRDIRVIDGRLDIARDHLDVRIDGDRIVAVEPHAPDRTPGPAERVVEGAGRTLLPGLIDAHTHYTFDPTEGSLQAIARRPDDEIMSRSVEHVGRALRAGITSARGAGSMRNLEVALRDRIAAGEIPGPRLVVAGTAVGAVDGHGSAFGLEATGPDALADATREVVARGADVVKAVASEAAMLTTTGHEPGRMVHGGPELTEAELRSIVATATDLGRWVMCHAQDAESVRRSAVAGVASVEHAWLADRAALEAMRDAGTVLVPTLVVTDVNRTLGGLTPVQRERQDEIERRSRTVVETAIALGIPLVTGTDTGEVGVTADLVWREIALLVDHGASAMAAIRAATSGAARLLGIDDEVGTVEVGKVADLLIVEGDPLGDIGRLAVPAVVIAAGRPVA